MPPAFSSRFATALLIAACAVFVVSRVWILGFATIERSTVGVFAEMGFEYRLAAEQGESFYALHARRVREDAAGRAARGVPGTDAARQDVEYPPLAVAWMVLPTYFGEIGDVDRYRAAFRAMHAAVDAITFLLTGYLARRIGMGPGWPLLVYALGGLALYPVLYDRIDLAMAALVAAALALLVSRAHWMFALAALALAVNFKLVPIVMAPAFVIGAIRAGGGGSARGLLMAMMIRASTFLALCGLMFLPFYLVAGADALGFLGYHADRGVQVESVPANLLLLTGQATGLTYTHGAVDVVSSISNAVSLGSTLLTLALLAAISIWLIAWAQRICGPTDRAANAADAATDTIAQRYARATVALAALLLWSSMTTAKVLSPQYVVWLLPLAPLVFPRRIFDALFLLMCAMTTVIFPNRYYTDIARVSGFELLLPTSTGVMLLTLRNALLVALLIALAWAIRRRWLHTPVRGGSGDG